MIPEHVRSRRQTTPKLILCSKYLKVVREAYGVRNWQRLSVTEPTELHSMGHGQMQIPPERRKTPKALGDHCTGRNHAIGKHPRILQVMSKVEVLKTPSILVNGYPFQMLPLSFQKKNR